MTFCIYPSLVLVQVRNTRHCITERLLMGRKESNQTQMTLLILQQFRLRREIWLPRFIRVLPLMWP